MRGKVFMASGQVVRSRTGEITGVILADGKLLKKGGTFFYSYTHGESHESICDAIAEVDGEGIIVKAPNSYSGDSYWATRCYGTKQAAERVEVALGKRVGNGDIVWLWRWSGSTVSLVRKQVCAIKNGNIQCTYMDNYWPRKEDPKTLYTSKEDALKDKSDWANRMDVALYRAGAAQVTAA